MMASLLQSLLGFLVGVGLLVLFHELGHYLVARWAGVKVLRFSLGFGRPLASRRIGKDQTEWVLAAVPFGGYVKMLDEREGEVAASEVDRAFNRQPVSKRIAIVLAGPCFNLLLTVLLYTLMFVHGMEGTRATLVTPVAGSAVAAAGLASGDEVKALDAVPVQSWQDLRWRLLQASGKEQVVVRVDRGGTDVERVLNLRDLAAADWEGDFIARLGFVLYRPPLDNRVGKLVEGKPAAQSGLAEGDRILAVDGRETPDWETLAGTLGARPDQDVVLTVERAGSKREIRLHPQAGERDGKRVGLIGIQPYIDEEAWAARRVVTRYAVPEAMLRALDKTWELSVFTLKIVKRIITGEASIKNISGPVTMASYAGQSVAQGWMVYAAYLALLSVSLGVLNLLPIPVLDGGHLLYYTAELVTGRPVSERITDIGQRVGIALLFMLMGLALFNDFSHLFSKL